MSYKEIRRLYNLLSDCLYVNQNFEKLYSVYKKKSITNFLNVDTFELSKVFTKNIKNIWNLKQMALIAKEFYNTCTVEEKRIVYLIFKDKYKLRYTRFNFWRRFDEISQNRLI